MNKRTYYAVYETKWSLTVIVPFMFAGISAEYRARWDRDDENMIDIWALPL